ncbi:hypothetical protein SGPA1_60194 [Streptomyces misionensis JCM 4497]
MQVTGGDAHVGRGRPRHRPARAVQAATVVGPPCPAWDRRDLRRTPRHVLTPFPWAGPGAGTPAGKADRVR